MTSQSVDVKKISAMTKGGAVLREVKQALQNAANPGTTFEQIELLAQQLIRQARMKPSFSTVEGYAWATCVMKNEALCHGIPRGQIIESGDLITIDVGLIHQGFHLDTTISFAVGEVAQSLRQFLSVGERALAKAIAQAKPGSSVFQVSRAMQKVVERAGYGAVYQLTGHGVGEQLHMEPAIPCVAQKSDKRVLLSEGQTLAIEIMYTIGSPELKLAGDGWTYQTKDRSVSAMFEETVVVGQRPSILT